MTPQRFSQGIEKILALAALDKDFRRQLFDDRAAALDNSEVELTGSERKILLEIPGKQLHQAIINARVPEPARRAFLQGSGRVIVTTLAVAGGIFLMSTLAIGSTAERAQEAIAIQNLRNIAECQREYRAKFGKCPETLQELVETGFQTGGVASGEISGYRYIYSRVGETGWRLKAIPVEGKKKNQRSFFIDETGILRFSKTKSAGPESEPLD